jgi:plasmid maintenance system killer protein
VLIAKIYEMIGRVRNLEDLKRYPQLKLHPLHGNREGQLAVSLDGPYRLVFEPYHDPLPMRKDGGTIDWARVTCIRILKVEDYHRE